jgi:hypothetical protein
VDQVVPDPELIMVLTTLESATHDATAADFDIVLTKVK